MSKVISQYEARAIDVLDRMEEMGICQDLVEAELIRDQNSENFKRTCLKTSFVILDLCQEHQKAQINNIIESLNQICRFGSANRNPKSDISDSSKLNNEMLNILKILDPNDHSNTRIEIFEKLISFIQVNI